MRLLKTFSLIAILMMASSCNRDNSIIGGTKLAVSNCGIVPIFGNACDIHSPMMVGGAVDPTPTREDTKKTTIVSSNEAVLTIDNANTLHAIALGTSTLQIIDEDKTVLGSIDMNVQALHQIDVIPSLPSTYAAGPGKTLGTVTVPKNATTLTLSLRPQNTEGQTMMGRGSLSIRSSGGLRFTADSTGAYSYNFTQLPLDQDRMIISTGNGAEDKLSIGFSVPQ